MDEKNICGWITSEDASVYKILTLIYNRSNVFLYFFVSLLYIYANIFVIILLTLNVNVILIHRL